LPPRSKALAAPALCARLAGSLIAYAKVEEVSSAVAGDPAFTGSGNSELNNLAYTASAAVILQGARPAKALSKVLNRNLNGTLCLTLNRTYGTLSQARTE